MKNTSISWLRVSLFVVVILISFLNLACASAQEGTATQHATSIEAVIL